MNLHRGMTRGVMASDMGALRDQTALNIRERGDRRKQKPLKRPEWHSLTKDSWPRSPL